MHSFLVKCIYAGSSKASGEFHEIGQEITFNWCSFLISNKGRTCGYMWDLNPGFSGYKPFTLTTGPHSLLSCVLEFSILMEYY